MTEETPYKVCFLAYCCEPGRGSEWGLGWSFVQDMSRTQPVWVVVHDDCRPALDRYLAEHHTGHPVYPVYVKLPRALGWMRNSYYSLFNIHYYLWQFAAARALRKLHVAVELDIVQHVSLCRWWMPTAASALTRQGVGFIFGPVGGGEVLPRQFRVGSSAVSKLNDLIRYVSRSFFRRDPLLVRSIRQADLLVPSIPAAEQWFRKYDNDRIELSGCSICSSPAVLEAAVEARATRPTDGPFTFGSAGGLSYYRGVDLAIRAFAQADLPNARYVHACDGPMRPALEKLAAELGVGDRVQFLGDLPHIDNVRAMARADAMVHTVLRDSQGVLPDALYAGVPVITLDHLTPAMLVTPECGHLIPIDDTTTPQKIVDDLAAVMRQWYENPSLVAAKAAAAAERGKTFSAEARGLVTRAMHARVLRRVRERAGLRPTDTAKAASAPAPSPGMAGRGMG